MALGEMKTQKQQFKLSWQIEWIWHVYRLHPLDYFKDCKERLVDEQALTPLRKKENQRRHFRHTRTIHYSFHQSICQVQLFDKTIFWKSFKIIFFINTMN
jgi:hypothetical protein